MNWDAIGGVVLASIPGIIIALLSYALTVRHDSQADQRLGLNARTLLSLEIDSNRRALASFWQTINALDSEKQTDTKSHLSAMASGGLFGYTLPQWSMARWQHLAPQLVSALSQTEIETIDTIYRGLQTITDTYAKTITLTPEERELYNRDRFWANRFGDTHANLFERFQHAVQQVLGMGNPLAAKQK